MSTTNLHRCKRICAFLSVMLFVRCCISCALDYRNFYAGYPLKGLDKALLTEMFDRYRSEMLLLEAGGTPASEVVCTADVDGRTAVLFRDLGDRSFCALAEMERGPFGGYRIVRAQAGSSTGTVQFLSSWDRDLGILYSADCLSEIEYIKVLPGNEGLVPIPRERTFIQTVANAAVASQVHMFDADDRDMTASLSEGIHLVDYTIGNPNFFQKNAAIELVITTAVCVVMWFIIRRAERGARNRDRQS